MNIEFFREYCLALEGVTEKIPFGKFARRYDSILVFYVSGHMFCLTDMDDFRFIDLCSSADVTARLKDTYTSVEQPLNRAFVNWIRIGLDGDVPENVILGEVRRAYDIVRSKYARKPKTPDQKTVSESTVQLGLDSCGD